MKNHGRPAVKVPGFGPPWRNDAIVKERRGPGASKFKVARVGRSSRDDPADGMAADRKVGAANCWTWRKLHPPFLSAPVLRRAKEQMKKCGSRRGRSNRE